MNDLTALTDEILAFRRERDWEQFHTPRNLAASICIESAELLENFQWAKDEDLGLVVEQRREQIQDELADILIYGFLLGHDLRIDIIEAVRNKLRLNSDRYPTKLARGSSAKYDELI